MADSATAATAASESSSREAVVPIVVGSVAFSLGADAEHEKSHEWTVYVRHLEPDVDLALLVEKVVFMLHPSFEKPTRLVDKAPFAVTEKGWGEFEIHLAVHFHGEPRPIALSHVLKLYPEGGGSAGGGGDDGDASEPPPPAAEATNAVADAHPPPVVAEHYDEVIFREPSESLRQRLAALSSSAEPSPNGWRSSALAKWFTTFDAEAQRTPIDASHRRIAAELQTASKRRLELEEELRLLKAAAAPVATA
jgi:YEATS domain-containing protein 4